MAEKKPDAKSDAKPEGAAEAPKKGGKKFALITVALLAIEGGVLFAVFSMGAPKHADAGTPPPLEVVPAEEVKFVELSVFEDRVSNDASGVTYQYKADIHLKVRKDQEAEFSAEVNDSKNEVREELVGIFRTAEPQHFQEPLHETLRRRIESKLRERFEKMKTKDHKPFVVERVLVVIGSGIRVSR